MSQIKLVAIDAKGNETLILGPDADHSAHAQAFHEANLSVLKKGTVKVQQWTLLRETTGIDADAQKRRLDIQAKEDADAKAAK